MRRASPGVLAALLLVAAVVAGGAGCAHSEEKQTRAMRPISNHPVPDPFIIRDGAHWYLYGTAPFFLQGKSLTPDALKKVDLDLDLGADGPGQIWGFVVHKHTDGSYHAYATLHFGHFKTAVGHLVPAEGESWADGKPITRWKLDRVLVGDVEAGKYAYESKIISDTDGTLYLVYSAFHGKTPAGVPRICIMAQRMCDPANIDPSHAARPILAPEDYRSEDRNPGGIQLVEGASFKKIKGKYVLVYTVGDFMLDNYKIGVAYSDTIIPPEGKTYQKVLIPDPDNLWGNPKPGKEIKYLLQTQISRWPNYCRELVGAPGVGSIVEIDGRPWLSFHGYLPEATKRNPAQRYDWLLPLEIDISAERPVEDWIRPVLPETTGTAETETHEQGSR